MGEVFVGARVFGEFDCAGSEVAMVLLEFRFEAAEQGEGVGGGAGESGEDLVVVEAAGFFGRVLDDGLAERDLSVAGKNHTAVAAGGMNIGGNKSAVSWALGESRFLA